MDHSVCLHMESNNCYFINQHLKVENVGIIIQMPTVDMGRDVILDMRK
jgi:hypothetical protein